MPLAGGPYRDNWGLSLMRAREVLTFLITPADAKTGGGGMPAKSWSAAGYGETDPVVANDAPENKQKNRRVELVVLPNVEEMLDLKSLTK
jgi:chemotaxis protein MotB